MVWENQGRQGTVTMVWKICFIQIKSGKFLASFPEYLSLEHPIWFKIMKVIYFVSRQQALFHVLAAYSMYNVVGIICSCFHM